jgi:hypothetical protein
MKKTSSLLVITALTVAGLQAGAGEISGTVTLKGTPPPEKEITQVKDDANCGKLHTEPVKTRFYVVGPKGELADVFVTLKGISGQSTGESATPAVIDQKGCEYIPYVFGVQTKQKILVKNSDPVLHNIHPTPAATGNKEENKAQMPNGPELTFSFPTPEMFLRFKCDVHSWMFSYACVVDHPFFAVTDKDGKFTIKNVKDGKYTVEFYHRKAAPATAPVTKEIEVKGDTVTADVTLEAK